METYDVCMVFKIRASNDDEARNMVTMTLKHDYSYDWAWIYTTLTERESTNGTDTNNA